MHELSILESMKDSILEILVQENAERVDSITLAIGVQSGVELEALKFAFPLMAEHCPELSKAKLIIEEVPVEIKCESCGEHSQPDIYSIVCEKCGSMSVTFLSGREILIKSMEIE